MTFSCNLNVVGIGGESDQTGPEGYGVTSGYACGIL